MRPCRPSSRRWRPLRRDAISRALLAPSCSWVRLGMADYGWTGADPHLALAALLVELAVMDLKQPTGEAVFVRRTDEAATQRGQRLQDLIADHNAHGWPSEVELYREVLALFPDSEGAA